MPGLRAARSVAAQLALLTAAGCMKLPSFGVADAGAGAGGEPPAMLRLLSPGEGQTGVPTNLVQVIVSFGAAVSGVAGGCGATLWMADNASGARLPSVVEAADEACPTAPKGTCYALVPTLPLPSTASIDLQAESRAILDSHGRSSVAPAGSLSFRTGAGPWVSPPHLFAIGGDTADGCLEIELESDEAAACTLTVWSTSGGAGDSLVREPLPIFQHDLLAADVPWTATPPTVDASVDGGPFAVDAGGPTCLDQDAGAGAASGPGYEVRCVDLAGNAASTGALPLPPRAAGRVVLNEVLARAAGGADAEFIELFNAGSIAVQLGGYQIAGAGGSSSTLPQALLPAGGYALVVGDAYMPGDGDVAPDPAALLLPVCGRLLGTGFPRSGGPVSLYDGSGVLASKYPDSIDVSSSSFIGRSVERIDPSSCSSAGNFAPNAQGSATPGFKNSVTP